MPFDDVVVRVGQGIDAVGVAVIVVGAVAALLVAADRLSPRTGRRLHTLPRVAGPFHPAGPRAPGGGGHRPHGRVEADAAGRGGPGAIVVIRTFLSFSPELEITGRWPWQKVRVRDGG